MTRCGNPYLAAPDCLMVVLKNERDCAGDVGGQWTSLRRRKAQNGAQRVSQRSCGRTCGYCRVHPVSSRTTRAEIGGLTALLRYRQKLPVRAAAAGGAIRTVS